MPSEAGDSGETVVVVNNSSTITGRFGRRRPFSRLDMWERVFLGVSAVNIALCIVFSIHRLVKDGTWTTNTPFSIILMLNSAFCMFYVIHGLLTERRFELYMYITAAFFMICYCIVHLIYTLQYTQKDIEIKIIRLVIACTLGPLSIGLAVKVILGFGWFEFQILGASHEMQGMFCLASWFSSLIKFDLQVTLTFLILLLNVSPTHNESVHVADIFITALGVPLYLLWLYCGQILIKRELKWAAIVFGVFLWLLPAYAIFQIVWAYIETYVLRQTFDVVDVSILSVGEVLLLVRIIVFIELVAVYRNFGKGLKERAPMDVCTFSCQKRAFGKSKKLKAKN